MLLSNFVMELPHVTSVHSFWGFVGLSFYTAEEELKHLFTIWRRRGSSIGERQANWKAKGIWFCEIFITSGGRESCQGNGWKDSTQKANFCGDRKGTWYWVGHIVSPQLLKCLLFLGSKAFLS